ncbi:hypothetical protein [Halobaculum lipolyticum]|uniref:Transglutaminase-like superfamily protein n=1 Tax=Halobaculum lipolyticum TaxID=3032001 RepID=A0ABD5WBN9_9EURY|nr:hypothetical protein [Halobaculum sp. DT31]
MTTPSTTDDRGAASRDRTRRSLLAAAGAAVAGAASCCLGGGGGGDDDRSPANDDLGPGTVRGTRFSRVAGADGYRLSYGRSIGGERRTLEVTVSAERYRRSRRADRSLAGTFDAALSDPVADDLAASLGRALSAVGVDEPLARIRAAVDVVRAMPYESDADSAGRPGYPRHVAETLVDHVGDCEDYAAVLAGVLSSPPFDLDPALVLLPGHAGVGVDPDAVGGTALPTTRVGDREYLYLDATYDVGLGRFPRRHDAGVVAVRHDGWRPGDLDAVAAQVERTAEAYRPFLRPDRR